MCTRIGENITENFHQPQTANREFPFDDEMMRTPLDLQSHLDDIAQRHPEFADSLRNWGEPASERRKEDSGKRGAEEEGRDEPGPLRGKLRNTVPDMQRREVEEEEAERAQRAKSAPPTDSGPGRPAEERQPTVRHIPIFVEGRDEPVLPKNLDSTPVKISSPFAQRKERRNTSSPDRTIPIHIEKTTQAGQSQTKSKQQAPPKQEQTPPPQPPPAQPQKKPEDPIKKVQQVQQEVDDLSQKVDQFSGTKSDKEFVYLDEMLTRNLLKLDNIETEGRDDVRAARKETIRTIQRCISFLENKATQKPEDPVPEFEMKESTPEIVPEQKQETQPSPENPQS